MIHQCAFCGNKIDTQEECYEEVQQKSGEWYMYHVLCLDTLRSIEHRRRNERTCISNKTVSAD